MIYHFLNPGNDRFEVITHGRLSVLVVLLCVVMFWELLTKTNNIMKGDKNGEMVQPVLVPRFSSNGRALSTISSRDSLPNRYNIYITMHTNTLGGLCPPPSFPKVGENRDSLQTWRDSDPDAVCPLRASVTPTKYPSQSKPQCGARDTSKYLHKCSAVSSIGCQAMVNVWRISFLIFIRQAGNDKRASPNSEE